MAVAQTRRQSRTRIRRIPARRQARIHHRSGQRRIPRAREDGTRRLRAMSRARTRPSYFGPQVVRVLTGSVDVQLHLPVYKTLFDFLSPNQFAAFPSMHSAMPWLVFLYAFKIWRWKSLPVLTIPVGTWFSAVYLGEHYFTDVLGGIAYASIAFIAVETLLPRLSSRVGFLRKHVPSENPVTVLN